MSSAAATAQSYDRNKSNRIPVIRHLIASLALLALAPAALAKDVAVTLGGDMIGPYRAMDGIDDPGFAEVVALFRASDTGFANQEGAIFDLADFAGFPAAETGGGYPLSPRATATGLRAMGITLVSKANNHATDWGVPGLLATRESLRAAGIVQAGTGDDPASACAAAASGPVALVSAATTFPPMSLPVAAVSRRGLTSRPGPGICALHVRPVRLVTEGELRTLRGIAGPLAMAGGPDGQDVRIADQHFRAAPAPGLDWDMKDGDVATIMTAIGAAKPKAGLTLFAVHAHETAGTADDMPAADFEPLILHRANEAPAADDPVPAAYVPTLLRQAVDAGADMVVRTGPHVLNGIELYRGKPIFYGLGSLFFDFGGRRSYTAPGGQTITLPPLWYETVIPVVTFRDGKLNEVRLHPATIDPDAGPSVGLPRRAHGEAARRILTRLVDLSRPYGTVIRIEGDTGIIRPVKGAPR
ncbi:MAG: CapA family protein [Sphingobium sp.]